MTLALTKPLLTENGIPPQSLAALSRMEIESLKHTEPNRQAWHCLKHDFVQDGNNIGMARCNAIVVAIAGAFEEWDAQINYNISHAKVHISELKAHETTFQLDANLHSDELRMRAVHDRFLGIRVLVASSMPASFLDFTSESDLSFLDAFSTPESKRVYSLDLVSRAADGNQIFEPASGEAVIFDSSTIHLPRLASKPHKRALYSAWLEAELPINWQERIRGGDAPKLRL